MNRYMQMVAAVAVATILGSGATACAAETRDAKGDATHAAKAPAVKGKVAGLAAKLKELTLTGILTRSEYKVAGKARTGYVLVTSGGVKLRLPSMARGGKNVATTPVKLADYVNQNVRLVAMGTEQKKGDKVVVRVKSIKAIEKSAGPAEAAPAKAA
jgi:hypothetical protein